jgi:hypothetical protein
MTTPQEKRVTSAELRQLFFEGKLDSLIRKKVPIHDKPTPSFRGRPPGTRTVGYECYDSSGDYLGIVFYYKQLDGQLSEPSPKLFLIDGTWYYV